MSSKQNDMIHLGNYEEFFILYMDNELSPEQKLQVEAFLSEHPGLQTEFDMLMSTKLPLENFHMNKEELMADNMKLSSVDEDLLLYIDNELAADKRKIVELELATNPGYNQQYQLLKKTILDAEEHIAYPNKEELYHRPVRIMAFSMWMRVAAAVVVTGVMGLLFFMSNSSGKQEHVGIAKQTGQQQKQQPANNQVKTNENNQGNEGVALAQPATTGKVKNNIAIPKNGAGILKKESNTETAHPDNQLAKLREDSRKPQEIAEETYSGIASLTTGIPANRLISGSIPAFDPTAITKSSLINKSIVTTPDAGTYNLSNAEGDKIASNNGKGSVKGFLRKATRLIEKRTGIDPTNGDGELLIGAVALKLN
jgi:hypothetical protein